MYDKNLHMMKLLFTVNRKWKMFFTEFVGEIFQEFLNG